MFKFIIKTFDQLKKDNFNKVKFDQVIIPQIYLYYVSHFFEQKFEMDLQIN